MKDNKLILGILSDNHGEHYPQIEENLIGCDAILHAGDVGKIEILKSLSSLGPPLYVATGNNDCGVLRKVSQEFKLVQFDSINLRVLMTHDPGSYNTLVLSDLPKLIQEKMDEFKPNLFVFGHWHKRFAKMVNGIYFFNPGGVTKKYTRDGKPGYSKLYVSKQPNNGQFSFEPEFFNL